MWSCDNSTEPASKDCAGVWGGTAINDDCIVGNWISTESGMTSVPESDINLSNENTYSYFNFNQDGTATWGNSSLSQQACEIDLDCDEEPPIITSSTGSCEIIDSKAILCSGQNIDGEETMLGGYFVVNNNTLTFSSIENYEHGVTNGFYIIYQRQ